MARTGVEVIVARNGQPVAKIIPWPPPQPERRPGAWSGQVEYHGDIIGPDEDAIAMFTESTALAATEYGAQPPPLLSFEGGDQGACQSLQISSAACLRAFPSIGMLMWAASSYRCLRASQISV